MRVETLDLFDVVVPPSLPPVTPRGNALLMLRSVLKTGHCLLKSSHSIIYCMLTA